MGFAAFAFSGEGLDGESRDSMLPASEKSVLSESPVLREKSVLQRDSRPSHEPLGVGTVLLGRLREAALRAAATADDAFGSVANCFCSGTGEACVVDDAELADVASWLKLRSECIDEIWLHKKKCSYHYWKT